MGGSGGAPPSFGIDSNASDATAPAEVAAFDIDSSGKPDLTSQAEAAAFDSEEDLEKEKARKEDARHQSFRNHVNWAALIIFWAIVWCLVWGISAFTWHLAMPNTWHYLDKEQLDTIKTILVSALFSSALSGYVAKRMA